MGQTNWGPITENPRMAGEGLEEEARPSAAKTHGKGLWFVQAPRTVLLGAQTNKMHSFTTLNTYFYGVSTICKVFSGGLWGSKAQTEPELDPSWHFYSNVFSMNRALCAGVGDSCPGSPFSQQPLLLGELNLIHRANSKSHV